MCQVLNYVDDDGMTAPGVKQLILSIYMEEIISKNISVIKVFFKKNNKQTKKSK